MRMKTLLVGLIVVGSLRAFGGETSGLRLDPDVNAVQQQGTLNEIASLHRIASIFDGGTVGFTFKLKSGSELVLFLNDQEQVGKWRGVPEQHLKDCWLWTRDKDRKRFVEPESTENKSIEGALARFLNSNHDLDTVARQQLDMLLAIVRDRKAEVGSWNSFVGYRFLSK